MNFKRKPFEEVEANRDSFMESIQTVLLCLDSCSKESRFLRIEKGLALPGTRTKIISVGRVYSASDYLLGNKLLCLSGKDAHRIRLALR